MQIGYSYISLLEAEHMEHNIDRLVKITQESYNGKDHVTQRFSVSMHGDERATAVLAAASTQQGDWHGLIEDVYTRPEFEGRGYASEIIKKMIIMSGPSHLDFYKITLTCHPRLIPFYERFGFRVRVKRKWLFNLLVNVIGITSISMRLDLRDKAA